MRATRALKLGAGCECQGLRCHAMRRMCTSPFDRPGLPADMNQREQTSMKPLLVINMVRVFSGFAD